MGAEQIHARGKAVVYVVEGIGDGDDDGGDCQGVEEGREEGAEKAEKERNDYLRLHPDKDAGEGKL